MVISCAGIFPGGILFVLPFVGAGYDDSFFACSLSFILEARKTVSYKSVMFSGLPNLALAFGYTNASWTLKCDLTNKYVCRLINHMDKHGYSSCTPTIQDPDMERLPFLDFTSGYVMRYIDKLPKSGSQAPWKLKHN